MGGRVDGALGKPLQDLPAQRIDLGDPLHRVAEKLDAEGLLVLVGGKDLDDVTTHPEDTAVEVDVVPFILNIHQLFQQFVAADRVPLVEEDVHRLILDRRTDAVDAGDRCDDDYVPPGKKAPGGGVAHLVDLVVDRGVLFDEGIGGGEVGFRLVVIVVGDEILHGVFREELPEFAIELRGQGLVGGKDQRGATGVGDNIGHGEGFAGTGHPEQHLSLSPRRTPSDSSAMARG